MTDWGQLYRENVAAVSALVGGLTEEQLGTTVPATPEWTVREVVAHLAGGPADGVAGRMAGAPGPEWTARHVAERAGVPVPDLVAELQRNQDATAASVVDNPRPAVVYDIAVHHADLHEALGLGTPPEAMWRPVVDAIGRRMAPDLLDTVAPYELFRALFSRRSRAQMQAWGTDRDAAQLDELCIFGPREDDQPLPA